MNVLLFFIGLYISLIGYFLLRFHESGYILDETIKLLKKDFKKIFKCCINKKHVSSVLSEEEAKDLEKQLAELDDCHQPLGINVDVCLNEKEDKEDIELKAKVIKIINKHNFRVKDGGKDKLVLPMEAIAFLNKNLNPLVSEHGEIMIKIQKDKEMFSSDPELEKNISKLVDREVVETKTIKEEIKVEKQIAPILEEDEEFEKPEIINGPDEDIFVPANKIIEKELEYKKEYATPYDDHDEEELSDEDLNDSLAQSYGGGINMDDLLSQAMLDMDEEEIEDNSNVSKDFFKNRLNYKSLQNATFDFSVPEESLERLFSLSGSESIFFSNLAKTTPLIFNSNKNACVVDMYNIFFAISKMFGMNAKEYYEYFGKLNKENINKLANKLADILEINLTDLITHDKKPSFVILKNKSDKEFFSYCLVFSTGSFKKGITRDFDLFRSEPYSTEFKFDRVASAEETKTTPRLVIDIKDVEIK